jgi:hypothetical protein
VNANELLTRLAADTDDGPLQGLAALSLEVVLDRPVGALVDQRLLVEGLRAGLQGWLDSETSQGALERVVSEAASQMGGDRRKLQAVLPQQVQHTLLEVLRRPFSPDRALVLTLLDRPPVRELVRQLLLDAVLEFGRRVREPVAGVAKGIGGIARFAFDTAKSRSGTLGAMVGAVGNEVERQFEKRASEFVESALSNVFAQIADAVSDPRRATEAAELRTAIMEGALQLTLPQLSRELLNLDVPGGAAVVRAGVRKWLSEPDSTAQLEQAVAGLLERDGARPLREVLLELGVLESSKAWARAALHARLREVVGSAAFKQWLEGVLA